MSGNVKNVKNTEEKIVIGYETTKCRKSLKQFRHNHESSE